MVEDRASQGRPKIDAAVKHRLVLVEWLDAEADASWADTKDQKEVELKPCFSIGWLIDENNQRIIICGCISPDTEEILNRQIIPTGMISRRITLWNPGGDMKWHEMWDKVFEHPEML